MAIESRSKILLLEDEKNLGATLSERLKEQGFDVIWVQTCRDALNLISLPTQIDLALLDVGLPDGSGFKVGEVLSQAQPFCSPVFLTACGNPEDRIRGLELGAEDYIVKPFHLQELILRIRNALKRATYLANRSVVTPDGVSIGRALIFFDRFEAVIEGRIERLSHKEAALLKLMVEKRGQVVSRDEILDHAWSADEYPTPRTVDNFIMRLRRLVEPNPEKSEIIRSVRGIGYLLS
ncbi:MAG: response regulator transcription factor [Bdellovibrio sp.]|nr:response regulator transcription factor [Bdellovibrio sp.]